MLPETVFPAVVFRLLSQRKNSGYGDRTRNGRALHGRYVEFDRQGIDNRRDEAFVGTHRTGPRTGAHPLYQQTDHREKRQNQAARSRAHRLSEGFFAYPHVCSALPYGSEHLGRAAHWRCRECSPISSEVYCCWCSNPFRSGITFGRNRLREQSAGYPYCIQSSTPLIIKALCCPTAA